MTDLNPRLRPSPFVNSGGSGRTVDIRDEVTLSVPSDVLCDRGPLQRHDSFSEPDVRGEGDYGGSTMPKTSSDHKV